MYYGFCTSKPAPFILLFADVNRPKVKRHNTFHRVTGSKHVSYLEVSKKVAKVDVEELTVVLEQDVVAVPISDAENVRGDTVACA